MSFFENFAHSFSGVKSKLRSAHSAKVPVKHYHKNREICVPSEGTKPAVSQNFTWIIKLVKEFVAEVS